MLVEQPFLGFQWLNFLLMELTSSFRKIYLREREPAYIPFSRLLFYFVFGGRAITIIFLKFVFIWAWNRYIIADSLLWVTQHERIAGACNFKRFVWKSWWKCYNHIQHVLFCFQKITLWRIEEHPLNFGVSGAIVWSKISYKLEVCKSRCHQFRKPFFEISIENFILCMSGGLLL